MTTTEPLVSVVTPVYNGRPFLAECVESVLGQTYGNWEYVIVDNCSTDGSLEAARELAQADGRIRVVSSEAHLPVIANWNRAVRRISPDSRYCKVVHADDCLLPECLTRMVALAEEHPSVGLVGGYALYNTSVRLDGIPLGQSVVSGRELGRLVMLKKLRVFGRPSALLIRSEIVREREAFYDERELHADRDACYAVLREWDFGFVHQVLTFVRVHEGSVYERVSRPLNTTWITDLSTLRKHGRAFLDEGEYRECFERDRREYYRRLAQSLLEGRDRRFWEWHRSRLAEIGEPFSRGRLAAALFGYVGDRLSRPVEALGAIGRRVKRAVASA